MNMVVCIKQVIDPEAPPASFKIDVATNKAVLPGVPPVIDPYGEYAVEAALQIKDAKDGKITAISLGVNLLREVVKKPLSMGADQLILLEDESFADGDSWSTAYALAMAIKKLGGYDLILCGRQTVDVDTAQVGPELAEMLGLPFVAYVSKIEEIAGGRMRAQRLIEEGHEVIESPLPAVISVVKEINVPRLPSLRGIMRAKKAAIPVWSSAEISADKGMVGLSGSATKVIKVFFPQRVRRGEMLQGDLEKQADTLIEKLREAKLI